MRFLPKFNEWNEINESATITFWKRTSIQSDEYNRISYYDTIYAQDHFTSERDHAQKPLITSEARREKIEAKADKLQADLTRTQSDLSTARSDLVTTRNFGGD